MGPVFLAYQFGQRVVFDTVFMIFCSNEMRIGTGTLYIVVHKPNLSIKTKESVPQCSKNDSFEEREIFKFYSIYQSHVLEIKKQCVVYVFIIF